MGVALATGGGPIGTTDGADDGISNSANVLHRGVSGASVVAGDDALDVGNPGRTIGKS